MSDAYEAPFRFEGTLNRVVVDLAPETLSKAEIEELHKAEVVRPIGRMIAVRRVFRCEHP